MQPTSSRFTGKWYARLLKKSARTRCCQPWGQTALNCALELERQGVLEEFGVTMIGATADAIDKAEDRRRFDVAMKKIGLKLRVPVSLIQWKKRWRLPLKLASRALFAHPLPWVVAAAVSLITAKSLKKFAPAVWISPTKELLIDESLIGWKEYEMEVVRDKNDNCIIVCSIENFDAMGIHTGDSITVAPAQTLTDKEYQIMRNASMAVLREIGVETGGSNVQFAVNPKTVA